MQRTFACKISLAANHHYPENFQRLFRLQKCLSRKSSLSWNYSKTFFPAKLSYIQIIIILKVFKDFFASKFVLSANHHYPENMQRNFACKNSLAANHHYPGIIQRLFFLQNCLRCKSSLSWKNSKTSSPAKLSQPQVIIILRSFKKIFRLQICLISKPSLS